MSHFIDKLNRMRRAEAQPLGFRTAPSASPRPKIQLVASLAQESADQLAEAVSGADAGLLRISKPAPGIKILQKISQDMPDIFWGVWRQKSSPEEIEKIAGAGGDFIVFSAADTPLSVGQSCDAGKILEVPASLNEGLLRAINELPADAVLIGAEPGDNYPLTWQHLMLFRRFADLLTKPLLVSIPTTVTAAELQTLWEAGVSGVVIALTPELPRDRLKELRQAIDTLPFPSPRQREKAAPMLPRIRGKSETTSIEEEPEEEEEY